MAGIGPPPKRDAERRRKNKRAVETVTVDIADLINREVEIPAVPDDWHPLAAEWYDSLAYSGQAVFYEPSDWAMALLLGEALSRELNPQPIVLTDAEGAQRVEMREQPMKGATLAAALKGMTALLVTEGDRRRLHIELERARDKAAADQVAGKVLSIVKDREAALS